FQASGLRFDRKGDEHYDTISVFIKSIRGSDPDAGIYYLARMLEGGEDPVFIARRLVVLASEDIGNADPNALGVAVNTLHAVELVGMPEARINLAQAVTYLASAPKSNRSYMAINKNSQCNYEQKRAFSLLNH
ncbi:MAG: replication-associated recombination protein A, partial [Bacteroidota bacterium]